MEEEKNNSIKAKAILTIPLRLKEGVKISALVDNGIWEETSPDKDEDEIRKLGLLHYAHVLYQGKENNQNSKSNIYFYNIKKDVTGIIENKINSISIDTHICVKAPTDDKITVENDEIPLKNFVIEKTKKTIFFKFDWIDGKKVCPFWGKTKLIHFPANGLLLIVLPVSLLSTQIPDNIINKLQKNKKVIDNDEITNLSVEDCYQTFAYLSNSIGYNKSKSDSNKDAMPICGENSIGKNFNTIWKELLGAGRNGNIVNAITPLYTKSLISYIFIQHHLPNNINKDIINKDLMDRAVKLAWTENRDGFVADSDYTATLKVMENKIQGNVYAASSLYGSAFVSDLENYNYPKISQFFWIYLRLILLKYSLHCLLDDINDDFGRGSLEELRNKYIRICTLKSQFYYSEISDQYDTSRLYHLFYEGFKIKELNEEVEEKLRALDEIISIKKDKKEETLRQKDIENDKKNGKIQIFITALVLVLTITSALNDFFDIIEDPYKSIPGIISVSAVIIVMIIFRDRLKDIFGKKDK